MITITKTESELHSRRTPEHSWTVVQSSYPAEYFKEAVRLAWLGRDTEAIQSAQEADRLIHLSKCSERDHSGCVFPEFSVSRKSESRTTA